MAVVLGELVTYFNYAEVELTDPRVKDWFLMGSPWPIIGISLVYLYVILNIGPKLMQNREPFNIDKLLVAYNGVQIIACIYIVIEGTRYVLLKYDPRCVPVDYSETPENIYVARIIWFYFIIKLIDLLDTVFFIMRKKENQISFLHVYHHWGMVLLSWTFANFLGGGAIMHIVVVNSFVHIIMYFYYLLTAYDKEYKKSVWWKKHITQLQLFQFAVLSTQHLNMLFTKCNFPWFMLVGFNIQALAMFCLFGDFYYQAYIKRRPTKQGPPPN